MFGKGAAQGAQGEGVQGDAKGKSSREKLLPAWFEGREEGQSAAYFTLKSARRPAPSCVRPQTPAHDTPRAVGNL